ncbi:MAG: SUF system Fe-S cluster assembly protein [Pseudomonadota bacterium]
MTDMTPPKTEDVSEAPSAPQRPMVGNQHQYLDGFLSGEDKPAEAAPEADLEGETLDDKLLAALRSIFDPEIPVNIYDLGLIYDCEIDEDNKVYVTMTLTTPNCPVAETMPGEVEGRLMAVEGVQDVDVNLVWDPPWTPERMTDEAKLELGFL